MRRRDFVGLAGGAAAWPLAAGAQQKMPVIGFLNPTSAEVWERLLLAFHQGLREAGYMDGKNVRIVYRWAEGHYDRLPGLAADLVRQNVDVIYAAGGDAGALAAKAATTTIPVVISAASDPVKLGLIASLSRPGGNVTGVSRLSIELFPKRLELLREALPAASVVAVMVNPNNPNIAGVLSELDSTARTFGSKFDVIHASNVSEIEEGFTTLARMRADSLIISPDVFFNSRSEQLGSLALQNRVPAIYQLREFAAAGGMMSLGADVYAAIRKTGVYVGKILNGAQPADMPIEQATKLDFIFNLKTAKALGVDVPTSLLLRADEVIE